MPTFWNRTLLWGITYRQAGAILLFYGMALLFYDIALTISQREWSKQSMLADFIQEFPRIVLDYGLKLLVTIPIWYLLFQRLRTWSLHQRLLLHLLLLPSFLTAWQLVYYLISDVVGIGRLRGDGQVWDTYIGGLFYAVQFGLLHAYAYHRDLRHQQQREADLRELALNSELAALKAQINPHFLYNTFNTISASVPPEQEHTREMLAQLADLFRYQLRASRTDQVTVADELEFIQKYLDLEKARFGDRLRVHYDIGTDVLDATIPPMLLQPLVENAVKHGIAPLIEGGDITVQITREAGLLAFRITDTGKGLNGHRNRLFEGVGLNNTRLRIEKSVGRELRITDNLPQGTIVAFELPVS
ncbi:sensor histidine kinase [Fibrivirga algicola]|uniref:Sensor histidine kinase n=1 Tax=Fibrivirga algicola TaxID=2950420 RepID=A0ABX0QJA4_9BACT|nr:histidine kinase [Fibrivirga algicola]NID10728.1 sensor histidine kinase [Fibrivirga algicola]